MHSKGITNSAFKIGSLRPAVASYNFLFPLDPRLQISHFPVFIPISNLSSETDNFVIGALTEISSHTRLDSKSRILTVRSSHPAMTLLSHQIAVTALIAKVCPGRLAVILK